MKSMEDIRYQETLLGSSMATELFTNTYKLDVLSSI